MPTRCVKNHRIPPRNSRVLARIIHGYWESWTVCHGFAEAVQAVINGEDTASVKPWHTPVNNPG